MAFEWSDLDTSAGALIRSGAGILSIVLGAVILSARPRQAFNTAFALVLVLNGINYGVYALMGGFSHFPVRELVIPGHRNTSTLSFLQVALLLGLGWALLRPMPRRRAAAALASAVALPVVASTPAMRFFDDFEPRIEEYGSVAGDRAAILDDIAYSAFLAASWPSRSASWSAARRSPGRMGPGGASCWQPGS